MQALEQMYENGNKEHELFTLNGEKTWYDSLSAAWQRNIYKEESPCSLIIIERTGSWAAL